MLNTLFMRAAATAVTLTFAAGPVSAENYRVLMMDYAFFPEISYVQDGDTITFVNMSGITRIIEAKNQSWATPEMADGAEATIPVYKGMQNAYVTRIDGVGGGGINGGGGGTDVNADSTDGTEFDGQDAEEGTIVGKLNFSSVPTIATD